jgi:hypothetical protein
MKKQFTFIAVLVLMALFLAACGGGETVEVTREVEVTRIVEVEAEGSAGGDQEPLTFAGGGDTLAAVQERGSLRCGGNQSVPGFG